MLLSYILAFHVIAIIAWMAGLLYLPRLFVYHAGSPKGSEQSETFKIMERRLLRFITTPAMVASWVFGLILAFSGLINWSADWLVSPQARARDPAVGLSRLPCQMDQGFRPGPQHPPRALLPHGERDPHRAHDCDRDFGHRQAVLKGKSNQFRQPPGSAIRRVASNPGSLLRPENSSKNRVTRSGAGAKSPASPPRRYPSPFPSPHPRNRVWRPQVNSHLE